MAKINGGIIGPNNPTGPFSAGGGVWRLEDAFNAQKAGTWPIPLGYQIPNSLRFNTASTDFLSRTPASTTNRRTFTLSFWFKRSALGANSIAGAGDGTSANRFIIQFLSTDELQIANSIASVGTTLRQTTQVFRDVSAWYHLVVAIDTTQATASNRLKVYVNGSEITAFTTSNDFTLNYDTYFNSTAYSARLGVSLSNYFSGYISEINFIDGQALTPSSFGETDTVTGIWKPKAYTGTYGTNGFYLKFANSASLGTDSSTYRMQTAQLDGTTNGIQRGANLTGIANGKTGTVSMWCNFTASASGTQILWSSRDNVTLGTTFRTTRTSSGNFQSLALNSAGTTIMSVVTSTAPLSSAGFYHIYFSWDLAVTNKAYLYINGSSVALTYTTFTNDTIQYSVPNHGLGGNLLSPFSPTTPAMFGQVYVNYSTYLDPVTNISSFYGGVDTPVGIGSTGQLPTGSSPIVYLDGDATTILTNKGTGGDFSAYGTLATGTTYTGTGTYFNNWTVNNLTSIDQSYDSPTNNFATFNSLFSPSPSNLSTFTEGNLKIATNSTSKNSDGLSTLGLTAGKWYGEFKLISEATGESVCGVKNNIENPTTDGLHGTGGFSVASNGDSFNNGSSQGVGNFSATYTTNDIISVALDLDNNKVYFAKNGSWTNGTGSWNQSSPTGSFTLTSGQTYFMGVGDKSSSQSSTWEANFGYPPFTIASGNADANGFGNFEYAVPSGYYALCTKNLALYG